MSKLRDQPDSHEDAAASKDTSASETEASKKQSSLPGAALPKGGGSIRGMGEKFETNPVTGTASLTVPILMSPGRDGFNPSLSLTYDSGNGQGAFGFGWALNLDAITRKTSKGLPKYRDDVESDVFLLSDAQELVPVILPDGSRHEDRNIVPGYIVHRYRPRLEGTYRRIERWTNIAAIEDVHWRVYTSEDVLSVYGRSSNSRIYNPQAPEQIFSWLLSDTRDWKGNSLTFTFKAENGDGVDFTKNHQKNRGDSTDIRRTPNRYIKSIRYGNRRSLIDDQGERVVFPSQALLDDLDWMFEAIFDYGEHDKVSPTPQEVHPWAPRSDAFSKYTSGFEVRVARLCRRVLMFHHFENEHGVGENCLVRSTDFIYRDKTDETANGIYSFLAAVEQSGYRRDVREPSGYVKRSVPRLTFQYSEAVVKDELKPVDPIALKNAPGGLASRTARWIDLYGEGASGILTEVNGSWYYKRNITPLSETVAPDGSKTSNPMFDTMEVVNKLPNVAGKGKFKTMDLEGDGSLSIVTEAGIIGFYQSDRNEDLETWAPFDSSFKASLSTDSLLLTDLTGDGFADAILTEQSVWHPSLGPRGFGAPESFGFDPQNYGSPALLFKNHPYFRRRLYFADMTGDGMQDVVLIGNGEICFWPNLGYGKFGDKVVMDNSPDFDDDEYFDLKRLILGDIDGSGTSDLIYLHRKGVRIYFNQCGNSWTNKNVLGSAQNLSSLLDVSAIDLHGNGTVCLAISDPLPAAEFQMKYIDVMGGVKPHLLIQFENNLGTATKVHYSTSTKFYLKDRKAGKPWISRLPYPVSVVEYTETYDHISRNLFTTAYAYHHGYYDGREREFRGFGMVEQWDTESLAPITFPDDSNGAKENSVPPTRTRSWFHLGIAIGSGRVSRQYESEYFHHEGYWLLPDTVLPQSIEASEEYDAHRALKGALLRQETYMDDAQDDSSEAEIERSKIPVHFSEMNYTITRIQPSTRKTCAIFTTAPRETLSYQLERNTADPRVSHQITLETNKYGQILREVAIGYGRLQEDATLPTPWDRNIQTKKYLTYTENQVTNATDDPALYPHRYRLPLNCQRREYELTGFEPPVASEAFTFDQFFDNKTFETLDNATEIAHNATPGTLGFWKRLLSLSRTIYRSDDLKSLLPLSEIGACGHLGQSYGFAFTASMFDDTYQTNGAPLVPSRDIVLTSKLGNGGGYFSSTELKTQGLFPLDDLYDGYWAGNGLTFFSLSDNPDIELAEARSKFYTINRVKSVFGVESSVTYDDYNLLIVEAVESMGNVVTIGERDALGNRITNGNDYRTLQPHLLTDVNGNRSAVATDALGAVVGSAVMGKPGERVGDNLTDFEPDLPEDVTLPYLADPTSNPKAILKGASARFIYDLAAYTRSKTSASPKPAVSASISRVTHESDLTGSMELEMHHSFTYSDGFGRVIQSKVQAKPGPVVKLDADGHIILDDDGQPVMTDEPANPRWISTGWVIHNNKGLVVAQYEPFFTHLQSFEFDVRAGVSSVAFYDALGRNVVTLHPNGTYAKNTFTPWTKTVWDNNDTVELDPRTDPHTRRYTKAYFDSRPTFKTWMQTRMALPELDRRRQAAEKARVHAETPVVSQFDSLGRIYLNAGFNRVKCVDHALDGQEWRQYSRIEFDIQGRGRVIRDADTNGGNDPRGRIIETFLYDMLGRAMVRRSIDSGRTIYLQNAISQPFYQWNERGHRIKTIYDKSARHLFTSLTGDENAPGGPTSECIINYKIYGEHHPAAAALNMRGRVYLVVDQAALTINEKRDFKGLLMENSRRLNVEYKKTVDWAGLLSVIPMDMDTSAPVDDALLMPALNANLQHEIFRSTSKYDALNRPLELTAPNSDGETSTMVLEYNINSIKQISAIVRRESATPRPIVTSLDYDARGLRQHVSYANGVTTQYKYFSMGELARVRSTRPTSTGFDLFQDLQYTYDPSNNCVNIEDVAESTIYFRNRVVDAVADYTHDALYQLIRATGREHLGQPGGSPIPFTHDDSARSGPQPGDGGAMGTYTEDYVYDHTGNLIKLKHSVDDPRAPGHTWTREFSYAESSMIEAAKFGNRLSSSLISGRSEEYLYDKHGNMTRMPHLGGPPGTPNMFWNYTDQLKQVDLGGGGTAYYVYDSSGRRVRKVIERGPNLTQERIYLGGMMEIFRKHESGRVTLERESFHVGDDQSGVLLIETRTIDVNGSDRAPRQVQRYQLTNHQNSTTVELDETARVLSYEEYSPYGSTTYSGTEGSLELPKRYRFTGKERDEETGLSYHGDRYYAPWLCRWISADPAGGMDGLNLYQYCLSNPVHQVDPNGGNPTTGFPEWLTDIMKGYDAQDMVLEQVKLVEEGVEKEIWIGKWAKEELKEGWEGIKRLDIITKDGIIQVKYVELKDGATKAMKSAATLENRALEGIKDARQEVTDVADYLKKVKSGGWVNERAAEVWKDLPDGVMPKHTLTFVVEGEPHEVNQFRKLVEDLVERVAKGHPVNVIEGSYKSAKTIFAERAAVAAAKAAAKAAAAAEKEAAKAATKALASKAVKGAVVLGAAYGLSKAAAKLVPGAGLAMSLKDFAAADNTTDRLLAAGEIVGGVLEIIPAANVIGTAINLAMFGARMGVEAYRATHPEGGKQGPVQEKAADPSPAPEQSPLQASTPQGVSKSLPGWFGPVPDKAPNPWPVNPNGVGVTLFRFDLH